MGDKVRFSKSSVEELGPQAKSVSPTAIPASIYAQKENVFTLAMACSDKVLENNNVQRFYVSGEDDMRPLVNLARKNYKTLAIIYGNDEGSISNKNIMMRDYCRII